MSPCAPKPPSEAEIQQEIRLALGMEPGLVLWRNNVGATVFAGSSRPVQYGIGGKGGSDLIGILSMRVSTVCEPGTSDTHHPCLGHECTIARFIALEIKKPGGRPTKEQIEFIALVRSLGGFACIVHSVEEARAAVDRARNGETS